MKKLFLLSLLCFVSACGGIGGSAFKKVNATNALAALKLISSTEFYYFTDKDSFTPLAELVRLGYCDDKNISAIMQALESSGGSTPYNGYLFRELNADTNEKAAGGSGRYALAAYPAEPGKTGDIIYLMLLDMGVPVSEESGRSSGGEFKLWSASSEKVKAPASWPSEAELAAAYTRMDHTPQEGLRMAGKISGSHRPN